ncbi:MAG: ABC transporter substrate-binding protein [Streptosporangiaceae bacterium]
MRRRLPIGPGQARLSIATGAAALAALSVLTGCGSSSNGASSSTTLTFFGADYGTGPANSTSKYWNAIAAAFHKANPSITVNVQTVDWTDFPNKVQTLVQNKQFPDILEGDAAPQFAQSHLLYPDDQVLAPSVMKNLIPTFLKDGQYQGTDYGIPFTTSTRALYYNKKIFATTTRRSSPRPGSPRRRRPGPSSSRTRPRSRRRATSATACRWAARRRRPNRCCGSWATAAAT